MKVVLLPPSVPGFFLVVVSGVSLCRSHLLDHAESAVVIASFPTYVGLSTRSVAMRYRYSCYRRSEILSYTVFPYWIAVGHEAILEE